MKEDRTLERSKLYEESKIDDSEAIAEEQKP